MLGELKAVPCGYNTEFRRGFIDIGTNLAQAYTDVFNLVHRSCVFLFHFHNELPHSVFNF